MNAFDEFNCFLDGKNKYIHVLIAPDDKEKTIFTCSFGTYALRRMSFGLCNALTTFQICIMSIFFGFTTKTMEVFMDDFTVHGDSFDECLLHLTLVLS